MTPARGSGLKYKKVLRQITPHTPKDTPAGVSFFAPAPTGSPVWGAGSRMVD